MGQTTNKFALSGGVIPVFLYYAAPASVGLMAITTASLVDGIFLGRYVGSTALATITLLIPYLTLLFAIALMLAIGGSVRSGKYLGEESIPSASAVFSQSLITIIPISLLFAIFSHCCPVNFHSNENWFGL